MGEGYSAADRAEIERRLIEGLSQGRPLAELCREEGMPCRMTVYSWRDEDAVLAGHIARAREAGFDAIAEQCLEIADDTARDTLETDTGEIPNKEWIMRSKLRVETRLKLLSKWAPKAYGDKLEIEHQGGIGITVSSEDAAL